MSTRASLNHVYRTVWNESLGAMVAVAEIDSGRGRSSGASRGSAHQTPSSILIHLSALALGVALAWGAMTGCAFANPTGGVAVAGQATMVTTGNRLLVTTQNAAGTNHSAINWQSFSIPTGNTTYFQQPNATSTVINRVVTNTPSAIFGTLSSNGNVVLVNQSGIAVGTGAVVDTAGFTASSLRMTDADALAGRMRFGDGAGATTGVSVQGSILARSGDVVLLGAKVDTALDALIQAPNGTTILAAGQQIEITGRGLEGIKLQVQAPTDQAVNLGTLKGEAVGIFAGTLRHSGLIQATRASLEGGKVVLKSSGDAFVEGAGKIVGTGTTGGSVDVLGDRVAVTDQATIDVSGAQGGGNVRVGGDYQGKNPDVQNANFVYFGPQASIKADATDNGNGGRVIVWADDTTRAHGAISARGGAWGGDGGFVETSGKQSLVVADAHVDTRAPLGATGLWLLDPNNIDIVSGATFNVTGSPSFTSPGAGTLNVTSLNAALGSTNVSVTAIDNLTVSAVISGTSNNLSLLSTNGSMSLGASVSLGIGSLKLKSGGGITQSAGNISASSLEVDAGGAVSLNNANSVSTIAATVSGGGFSYKSAGPIVVGTVGLVTGVSTSGGAVTLDGSTIQISNVVNAGSGSLSLISAGSITQGTSPIEALTAGSLSVISASSASLFNDSNAVGTFNVSSPGTGSVTFANAGSFSNGPTTFNGSMTLKSNNGAITQSGAMALAGGGLTVIAGTGSVTLNNAANNLSNLTVTSAAAVDVKNSSALTVGFVSADSLSVKATGNITQGGAISTSAGGVDLTSTSGSISATSPTISATGGGVRLFASSGISLPGSTGSITTNAGGDAIILSTTAGTVNVGTTFISPGTGRWLVYVPVIAGSSFPTGMAFKQYNATYGSVLLGTGNGVIVAAAPSLTLSSTTFNGSVSKVYDGNTGISLSGVTSPTITGGAIDGDLTSSAVLNIGSLTLDDKNVGTGKLVTASGVAVTGILTSGGKPVYGYAVPIIGGNVGTVTQRATSTWTGGSNNSWWGSAGNWDALPDGANVANVIIPAGAGPIVFGAFFETTSLKSLTSGSPIIVSGGTLKVSDGLNIAGYDQTGGAVSGGSLKVVGPFNQTGGSIDVSTIDVLTSTGGIVFSNLKAPTVSLTATNGSITQLGGITAESLKTSSNSGTVLNDAGNRIGSFIATNTSSGNVELTNVGALGTLDINNAGGNVVVSNIGGITTKTVKSSGRTSITANSPLTVGSGGVSAGGNIVLTATNLTSSGDMTLNGLVYSSGGSVELNAANNLTQNSIVYGAAGVTAVVGGTMTLGPGAASGAMPVTYKVAGVLVTPPPLASNPSGAPTIPTIPIAPTIPIPPVTPPPPPAPAPSNDVVQLSNAVVQTNLVTAFLDKFEVALLDQKDGKPGKDKSRNELVLEGETCRP